MNYNKNNTDLYDFINIWLVLCPRVDFGVFFAVTLLALWFKDIFEHPKNIERL